MKTIIIDNYDSFTHNIYQCIGKLNGNPIVYKNNSKELNNIESIKPSHIIISPGPGTVEKKEDFGMCEQVIRNYMRQIPILGICLGHQGIAKIFGGKIQQSKQIMHGKQSQIQHNNKGLFKNIKNPFTAMRYHSLCVAHNNFPKELEITALSKDDNTIMGFQHKELPLFAIQFHPESFATEEGGKILKNFLAIQHSI